MKKAVVVAFVLFGSFQLNAQILSGSAVDYGRKQIDSSEFIIYDKYEGMVEVEVSINREGDVTGVRVIGDGTTVTSTPSIMKAQNAAKHLKFTPGTYYDKFQHARVRYTYKKGGSEEEEWIED